MQRPGVEMERGRADHRPERAAAGEDSGGEHGIGARIRLGVELDQGGIGDAGQAARAGAGQQPSDQQRGQIAGRGEDQRAGDHDAERDDDQQPPVGQAIGQPSQNDQRGERAEGVDGEDEGDRERVQRPHHPVARIERRRGGAVQQRDHDGEGDEEARLSVGGKGHGVFRGEHGLESRAGTVRKGDVRAMRFVVLARFRAGGCGLSAAPGEKQRLSRPARRPVAAVRAP
jgi:hypothetical protein